VLFLFFFLNFELFHLRQVLMFLGSVPIACSPISMLSSFCNSEWEVSNKEDTIDPTFLVNGTVMEMSGVEVDEMGGKGGQLDFPMRLSVKLNH
jgi:hypothetical protein